jgi:hypothetical protein
MELITFESNAYYHLQAEQLKQFKQALIEAQLEAIKAASIAVDWITITEAKQLIPYRSKTKWQELRDSGEIVFSKFGRKILYSKKSLIEYIKKYLTK